MSKWAPSFEAASNMEIMKAVLVSTAAREAANLPQQLTLSQPSEV